MPLLTDAREGFLKIDVDPSLKEKALANLETWLTGDSFATFRPQLEWLLKEKRFAELLDAFYQVLPFGTGGRRGAVGIGPNRMNLWTLGASVQGHCDYLKARFPNAAKPLQVVLAYDVRQFEDRRKVYNPKLLNPVLHQSSKDFAHYATAIYIANGIHAHLPPPDSTRYLATPELSYAIRMLQAHGGLNISASHNPPDDNGGKFYDERGAQPIPPEDQIMSDFVDQVAAIKSIPWADAIRSNKIHWLTESSHRAYIDLCRRQAVSDPPRFDEIRIVFTPLHGVGSMTALEALQLQGFRPIPVESQMKPDGQFPNVTKSPNPEVRESLDRSEVVAREHKAHLVLATDPDADRIGALACLDKDGNGDYRFITGNEIAALLTHYKLATLARQNRLPASPIVVTTEVTTSLIGRIARHFNCQVVDNLMVGFKFMAEVLWQLESTGTYEDVSGSIADFIIASEESHGILTTAEIRDKDAGGACVLMAEMALEQKRHGRTIPEYLEALARQFGYFRNELVNIVMTGIEGKSLMARMLESLRREPPKMIGGLAVTGFEDLRDENGRLGPIKGPTDAAGRNFLIFRLGANAKVALRPSGTEPKAKAYIEISSAPCAPGTPAADWNNQCAGVDTLFQQVANDFLTLALATVG